MEKHIEQEFVSLLKLALSECTSAMESGDFETAGIFMDEAFDLLNRLPNPEAYLSLLQ